MARTDRRPGRTIQSVQIAFSIIKVLQMRGRIGVTGLANELGHSKSTIHSHLRTLEEQKMLVRDDEGYRLSLRILDMANDICDKIDNYEIIRDEIDTLAEETNEISQFGIEEYEKISYLYKATGDQAVETASSVGKQQPMYSTALGKTILAYLPAQRTEEIVQSIEYTAQTQNTITSPDELYDELEQTAERGYGIDNEENIEGLRCVAAPVKNEKTVLGAVSITGPSSRFTDNRLDNELPDLVKRAANVIELNTRFS